MSFEGIDISSEDPSLRFEFISKLGEGSYGSVFKAIDKQTNAVVAVKVLNFDQGDSSQLNDIRKEINILKQCHCSQIVAYYGAFQKEGQLWIAMEFCDAGSLSDIMCIINCTLTEEQIAAVMYECLLGLQYLHKNHKIHRDLKSSNLLLNTAGGCKLADFGVSAEITKTLAKAATVIGTPYFMAPEVLQSGTHGPYDIKADIWSLGITAYELAVGEPPLASEHPMRAIFIIASLDAPKLPPTQPWSDQFVEFITACLQKNPENRPMASQLLSYPFLAQVAGRSQDIIRTFLAGCQSTLADYALQEQLAQQEDNSNQPRPNNKNIQLGANIDTTGTVAYFPTGAPHQSSFSPDIFQDNGTIVINKNRDNAPDSNHFGTIVMHKNGTAKRATMNQKSTMKNMGTFVKHAAPPPPSFNTSGTMVFNKPASNQSNNNNPMAAAAQQPELPSKFQFQTLAQELMMFDQATSISDKNAQLLQSKAAAYRQQDLITIQRYYGELLGEIATLAEQRK